jgi:hypothetical protein
MMKFRSNKRDTIACPDIDASIICRWEVTELKTTLISLGVEWNELRFLQAPLDVTERNQRTTRARRGSV